MNKRKVILISVAVGLICGPLSWLWVRSKTVVCDTYPLDIYITRKITYRGFPFQGSTGPGCGPDVDYALTPSLQLRIVVLNGIFYALSAFAALSFYSLIKRKKL